MPDPDDRGRIERVLQHPLSPVPAELRNAFNAYQLKHYWRFLLVVNLLGQAAYFSYGIADLIVVPDIADRSILVRSVYMALTLPVVLALFRWSKNVQLLDLLLPTLISGAAILWFDLLSRSTNPQVATYQYASVIFIVLANLCIQVRFLPSLITSLLISAIILHGVHRLNPGRTDEILIFLLVYLPVLFFSLFISWSTTLDRRRAFLRSALDDMTRQSLSRANEKLHEMANKDPLTGVSNRRYLDELGRREIARAQRHDSPLCALLLDVDHFKRINDTHGHAVGDKVLQALGIAVQAELRESDLLARFGGEEFIVLLPETDQAAAILVAERLRLSLSRWQVPTDAGDAVLFTVSIGIAQLNVHTDDLGSLLNAADRALYRAKETGRNRVCAAAEGM